MLAYHIISNLSYLFYYDCYRYFNFLLFLYYFNCLIFFFCLIAVLKCLNPGSIMVQPIIILFEIRLLFVCIRKVT